MPKSERFDLNALMDPVVEDPYVVDLEFPFEQFVTHFISHGSAVHATVWIAQGPEPKGTVILAPQWYGGDRLESLIIPLMTAGINVMTFHPRGMWDNQHTYSLMGAADDLLAGAEFVRSTASGNAATIRGNKWRTDPKRIAVMGLSGGGGQVSLTACAEDPLIQAAIAFAPNAMAETIERHAVHPFKAHFDQMQAMTAGRIDLEGALNAMTKADLDRMNPIVQASNLTGKKVLLVGAQRDEVAPLATCHRPIAEAMRRAGVKGFEEVILESDHAFLSKRIAIARLIIGWLRQSCGF